MQKEEASSKYSFRQATSALVGAAFHQRRDSLRRLGRESEKEKKGDRGKNERIGNVRKHCRAAAGIRIFTLEGDVTKT